MASPPARPPLMVKCPQCGLQHPWSSDNPYRPFCSERCRLIDLGDWLDEKHAIPGDEAVALPDDNPDY